MSNRKGPRGQSESGGIAGGKSLFITKEGSGKTPMEDAKQDGNEAVKGREAPLTEIRCRSMKGLKRKIHYEQKRHFKKNVPPKMLYLVHLPLRLFTAFMCPFTIWLRILRGTHFSSYSSLFLTLLQARYYWFTVVVDINSYHH